LTQKNLKYLKITGSFPWIRIQKYLCH